MCERCKTEFHPCSLWTRIYSRRIEDSGGCWNWSGSTDSHGYGQIKWRGKSWLVHRLSYWYYERKPPKGLLVLHRCDNRRCINPDHLYLGTQTDNMRDMVNRHRQADTSGEANPRAKLTWNGVREIRRRVSHSSHPQGPTLADLARTFHVSKSTVSQISRGIIWKETSIA
jgi:hypothetical protein